MVKVLLKGFVSLATNKLLPYAKKEQQELKVQKPFRSFFYIFVAFCKNQSKTSLYIIANQGRCYGHCSSIHLESCTTVAHAIYATVMYIFLKEKPLILSVFLGQNNIV